MHRDVAGFCKFEQAAETSIPGHGEATADESDDRARTRFAARPMGDRLRCSAGRHCCRAKQFGPYTTRRNALLPQPGRHRRHKTWPGRRDKRCWTAAYPTSAAARCQHAPPRRSSKPAGRRQKDASKRRSSVPCLDRRSDRAPGPRTGGARRRARNGSTRPRAAKIFPLGQGLKHGQQRGDTYAGTHQHDRRRVRFENKRSARRGDLQHVSDFCMFVKIAACDPVALTLYGDPVDATAGRSAKRVIPHDGSRIHARPEVSQ